MRAIENAAVRPSSDCSSDAHNMDIIPHTERCRLHSMIKLIADFRMHVLVKHAADDEIA